MHPAYLAGVTDGPCRSWENGPGTLHRRIPYPPNLAGVPDDPCRSWENGPGTLHRRIPYPPNLAGVPDALIFFCFLFLHQGKKRKGGLGGNAPNYTIDNDDYGTEKAGSAFQPSEHAPRFSFWDYTSRDVSYRIAANRRAISGTYRRTPSGKKNRTSRPARMASRTKVDETSIIGAATARTSAVSSAAISGAG